MSKANINLPTKAKKLWENPNPSSNFAAQTVNFNSSDYDVVEWFYKMNTSGTIYFSARTVKGHGTRLTVDTTTGSPFFNYRSIGYVSDTSYSISGSNGTQNDTSQVIPIMAIGYKLSCF